MGMIYPGEQKNISHTPPKKVTVIYMRKNSISLILVGLLIFTTVLPATASIGLPLHGHSNSEHEPIVLPIGEAVINDLLKEKMADALSDAEADPYTGSDTESKIIY